MIAVFIQPQTMKALSDFVAIILFFATYMLTQNMVTATIVAVVIGVIQAGYLLFKYKKLQTMQWLSLILIVVFGGLTILLKDGIFIMLKTTLLMWLTAAVMLVSQLMGKNGVCLLLQKELKLPEKVWQKLGYSWIIFFFFMGLLNLWVAYPFTAANEPTWVKFKMYVFLPLNVIFVVAQGIYLMRHLPKDPA